MRVYSIICLMYSYCFFMLCFFLQAEDGIRDLVRSRGLGDVYKRQDLERQAVDGLHMAGDALQDQSLTDGEVLGQADDADERGVTVG